MNLIKEIHHSNVSLSRFRYTYHKIVSDHTKLALFSIENLDPRSRSNPNGVFEMDGESHVVTSHGVTPFLTLIIDIEKGTIEWIHKGESQGYHYNSLHKELNGVGSTLDEYTHFTVPIVMRSDGKGNIRIFAVRNSPIQGKTKEHVISAEDVTQFIPAINRLNFYGK